MIRTFVDHIETIISLSPIILSSQIEKYFDPGGNSVYLKGQLLIIDFSILEIAIFALETSGIVLIDKYRFHYMNSKEQIIFRYDNAPHHPEISTFPHHKHLRGKIISSFVPSLKDILNEISAVIFSKQS